MGGGVRALACLMGLAVASWAQGEAPVSPEPAPAVRPVARVEVRDTPYDAGGSVDVFWTLSPDEVAPEPLVAGYEVLRASRPEGPYTSLVFLGPGTDRFHDRTATRGVPFYYVVRVRSTLGPTADSEPRGPVVSRGQWFDARKLPILVALVLIGLVALTTKPPLSEEEWVLPALRSMAGILEGSRGGTVVYVPGTRSLEAMGTIASITLLEELCKVEGVEVVVLASDPLAFSLASSLEAPHVRLAAPDPAVLALTFTGEALREPPKAGIVAGEMDSEGFLMTEALKAVGAPAVGANPDLPETSLLLASCDLTLIGEELFLVGPMLTARGLQVAAAHDRLKNLVWALIALGLVAAKFGMEWYVRAFEGME